MIVEGSGSSYSNTTSRIIMHVDFDYFFAQCEELRRPELQRLPLVICVFSGRTGDSGTVSTANYVARKFGVKSGIPIRVAKAKLADVPNAVFLPLDATYYSEVSKSAMSVISWHGDKFECVGIDECYLDVSNRTGSFDDAARLARKIKDDVKKQTRLTCSIGVAPNKILAKMASDMQKPDGLTLIGPNNAAELIACMDTAKIPGIGPKTSERLQELGVKTIGDLARFDLFRLIDEFGKKTAIYMHNAAQGHDEEPVIKSGERRQIIRIVTLKNDVNSSAEMQHELQELCQSVFQMSASQKLSFKTVGIMLILTNLDNVTRSKSLKVHTTSFESLHQTAKVVLDEAMKEAGSMKVRRLGVRLSDLKRIVGQNTLFDFMV